MSGKDFRVTVKVRNNNILRYMEAAGVAPGSKFADSIGISYPGLNDLINMTASPFLKDGSVRPIVETLCIALEASFDDLFSDQQCEALATNKSEREMDAEQVFALTQQSEPSLIEDEGMRDAVHATLEGLTEREQQVIEMRFGMDGHDPYTLAAVGEALNVTTERIRQIEAKAMRKMRHPSRADNLRPYLTACA